MIEFVTKLAVFAGPVHPEVINFRKNASAGEIPASIHSIIVDVPAGTGAL